MIRINHMDLVHAVIDDTLAFVPDVATPSAAAGLSSLSDGASSTLGSTFAQGPLPSPLGSQSPALQLNKVPSGSGSGVTLSSMGFTGSKTSSAVSSGLSYAAMVAGGELKDSVDPRLVCHECQEPCD